jgi:hypothetical protein
LSSDAVSAEKDAVALAEEAVAALSAE